MTEVARRGGQRAAKSPTLHSFGDGAMAAPQESRSCGASVRLGASRAALPSPPAGDILTADMPAKRANPTVAIASAQRAVRVPRKRIVALVACLARQEGVRLAHVDVAVVTGRKMAALNRRYLGRPGATDVLSFDMSDELSDGLVAQIVVCGDVAARQAPRHGNCVARELLLYVVHGLLHLTGYDDTTPALAAEMHARAKRLLAEVYPPPERRGAR